MLYATLEYRGIWLDRLLLELVSGQHIGVSDPIYKRYRGITGDADLWN